MLPMIQYFFADSSTRCDKVIYGSRKRAQNVILIIIS